jgi:hypothetical protein
LRASVGSTEAAKDVVARFGRIDRSSREATSPFGAVMYICHPRPVNGYVKDSGIKMPDLDAEVIGSLFDMSTRPDRARAAA